jgi:hypothetical protein
MGFRTAIVLSLAFLAVDGARLAYLGGPRRGVDPARFIAFPDISQWNNYVLTDSFYISAIVATLFATHRVLRAPTAARFAGLGAALLFVGLLRPSGWLVIAVTVPFLWFELQGINRRSVLVAAKVVAAGITVLVRTSTFRGSVYSEHPDGGLAAGSVIDGYRAADHRMPSPSFTMDGTLGSVARCA